METDQYNQNVREQYESYPYPPRNPEDEKTRLNATLPDLLCQINHYCYRGKRDFSRAFRVLIAGGGTGDATIFLAEQFRGMDVEVVYLDISLSSMEVAQKRAAVRQLSNIRWVHGSLLELPNLNLGKFDYINCSGVLHHLDSPDDGLRALKAVLKSDGAICILVYGKYGRTGVYQMQELMRLINRDNGDAQQMLDNTKAVLHELPATNWFRRGEELITDHKTYGDAGIYDIFLHSCDRAYSVPELYEWVEGAGLHIQFPYDAVEYQPESYIRDAGLLQTLHLLPPRSQQAAAEIISGSQIKHVFYATGDAQTAATLDDLENVPFMALNFEPLNAYGLFEFIDNNPGQPVKVAFGAQEITFMPGLFTKFVFKYLNGEHSLGEIFDLIRNESTLASACPDNSVLLEDFRLVFRMFNRYDGILLRHKGVERFKPLGQLQSWVSQKYRA